MDLKKIIIVICLFLFLVPCIVQAKINNTLAYGVSNLTGTTENDLLGKSTTTRVGQTWK